MENVILVDEQDNELGTMEKMEAHRKGLLHRAFSVLLFNSKGELLLQKRAGDKYHCPGLWTNTCCSHPKPGENLREAARRRLSEEMGIELQPEFAYHFIYEARLDDSLIEHEFDHVFTGKFDGMPHINTEEVADWRFISTTDVKKDIIKNPLHYTPWFKLMMQHDQLGKLVFS